MKIRAAVLRQMGLPAPYAQSRPLEVTEVELDPPGFGEVLVRIHVAGLCHSDLSVINGDRPRVLPMALGHESSGEVVAVGPGVELMLDANQVWRAGDAVCRISRLERFDPAWIEEPIHALDLAGNARVRASVRTPVASGESLYTRHQFAQYAAAGRSTSSRPTPRGSAATPSGSRSRRWPAPTSRAPDIAR